MRPFLALFLILPSISWGDGIPRHDLEHGANIQRQEEVNQFYLDEISHKAAAPSRIEKTKDSYKDNPRNVSFAASFGSVYSRTPARVK